MVAVISSFFLFLFPSSERYNLKFRVFFSVLTPRSTSLTSSNAFYMKHRESPCHQMCSLLHYVCASYLFIPERASVPYCSVSSVSAANLNAYSCLSNEICEDSLFSFHSNSLLLLNLLFILVLLLQLVFTLGGYLRTNQLKKQH